jgi:hypothetical protein
MMKRLLFVASLFVTAHQSSAAPATIFQLAAGFAAKESCSCAFVVGQTDKYCIAFGQQAPLTIDISIDHTAKMTTATAGADVRTAHYGANGCTLDPSP